MKYFKVIIFNKNNPKEKDTITLCAESIEDAEDKALSNYLRGEGFGILRSYECDIDCGYLSLPQAKAVRERVDFLLGMFMTDSQDRNAVVESLLLDVGEDIALCAGWEDLDAEEYCEGDIDIALARIMKERLAGE